MIRAMRILIMFDLPTVKKKDLKNYRKWRSFLLRTGFIMMTESVYSRLAINKSSSTTMKRLIKENLPPEGDVQMLEITERQFASIKYLLGKAKTNVVDTAERYVEL